MMTAFFILQLNACLNLVFGKKAQLVAISETGAGGGGIRGVAFLSMPPSLAHRLPPFVSGYVCVCERERERVCVSGGTAGVGQSVNAADSYRRFSGDQRQAPGGFSLCVSFHVT